MKLNTIVNESMTDDNEYAKLAKRFMLWYGITSFNITSNNFIEQNNSEARVTITPKTDTELDLFDSDGICKLKFGSFYGDLCISGIKNIKSLANLPRIIEGEFQLRDLYNINDFDLDIIKMDYILIESSSFSNLSNIKNTRQVVLSQLHSITSFTQLPSFDLSKQFDNDSSLSLMNMTINTQSSDTNDSIYDLRCNNVNGITNFMYLPSNLSLLKYSSMKDFTNYIGIDMYKHLRRLWNDSGKIDNIITMLLCKNLEDVLIYNVTDIVKNLIKKYMQIENDIRSDHIMDCAVELIDAGYPEAAEL